MSYTLHDNTMNTGTDIDSDVMNTYTIGPSTNGLYWGTNGTSGSPGQVYTTNGTGATSWATITADPNLQGQTLSVKGNADISGELTIQGVKLSDRLDKIDERLAILHPNPELEEKWDKLRALRNAYMELEAEIKEKEKVWAILNK